MKKKVIRTTLAFVGALIVFSMGLYFFSCNITKESAAGKQLVMLNEIQKLNEEANGNVLTGQAIDELEESIKRGDIQGNKDFMLKVCIVLVVMGSLYTVGLFFYIYRCMIKPFEKLERYAQEIAGGNFDVGLEYERTNYFGAFTWAFDHMRKEILFAKKKEEQAIESNKTIVATLSHDIKTPIASIRAYSEALEANLSASYEKRQQYAGTIIRKCDEVTALVNDLVLHSLSELEKLEIKMEEVRVDKVIRQTVTDLGFENMSVKEPIPEATIIGDAKRIEQVLENLFNNARKYAPGKEVVVYVEETNDSYRIHVKDYGTGILPEDMPFIKQKFYRGKNTNNMPGSGLGLYIVDYIMEQMNGIFELHNSESGLDAVLVFLKTS